MNQSNQSYEFRHEIGQEHFLKAVNGKLPLKHIKE